MKRLYSFKKGLKLFWGPQASINERMTSYLIEQTAFYFWLTNKDLMLSFWYGLSACLITLLFLVIFVVYFFRRTQNALKAQEQKFMAGSCLQPSKNVIKIIAENCTALDITLMDLPLIQGTETKHILITGAYGSGKTNAIKHILNQIPNQKVLVVDTKGELIQKYYNPDRSDIVMNPVDPLSIEQWIQDDSKTGWLFLSMTRENQETLKPLFAYWLSLAMKSLKDKQSKKQRTLWVVIHALSDLPKIKDLPLCLARGAHFGVCMILCAQDFQQLETIYGDQTSKALVEFCATHVLFRCAHSDPAQKPVHQINTQTQARYGNKQQISARELAYFPDFVSCVQLPYGYPATKIKWNLAP